ncbi:MAG: CGNR zinc finger domain-containing protein, partial [Actinomycetota bacterium]
MSTGALALSLVATVHQRRGAATDLISTADEVAAWCEEVGLGGPHPTSGPMQTRLRELREAIHRLATSPEWTGDEAVLSAIDVLNEAATRLAPPELTSERSVRTIADADGATVIAAIALDAIELLSTCSPNQIRECANEPCTSLFVDRSQAGRR